jgi:hypothetical protein
LIFDRRANFQKEEDDKMAKKMLVLSASPRKGGDSDLLCDQFLLGAREAGHQGVICGTGAWNIGDIKGRPAMEQAYEMGKNA